MAKPGRLVPHFGAGGRAASAGPGHGRTGPTSGVDPGAGHGTPCGWNRVAPTVRGVAGALLRSEAGETGSVVWWPRWARSGCRRPVVPGWPGRSAGAPRRLAEPSLASALSAAHAPGPQHGQCPLLRTERGTRFAPLLFPCSSMIDAVRARLGPTPRSHGRESTAKRGILRSSGGSRTAPAKSAAAKPRKCSVSSFPRGVAEGQWRGSACRESLCAIGPSARRPATEVTGRLPTVGSRGAVNDGPAERAAEVSPNEARSG